MNNRHRNPYTLLIAPASARALAVAHADGGSAADPPTHPSTQPSAHPSATTAYAHALPDRRCPLCHQPVGFAWRPDSRCGNCQAPLAALPGPGQQGHEMLGRRGAVRRDQSHVATVHVGWPAPALPVRWRDLSLTGLAFYAAQPMSPGQRLHLIDPALELVGEVVGCRAQGRVHAVHARLLTALLLQTTGVFVSTQA